jgi:hypothetical protein
MKLSLEIIYKRKQSTKQSRLEFSDRQSVLIKAKHKCFILTSERVSKDWSPSTYFSEVRLENVLLKYVLIIDVKSLSYTIEKEG